ncbi:MAG: DUF5103 domain-containing protein [Bacteroidales bacterium]|jgi:hypothetical protein|nr:DUF5103 domain-containing protein [Bacteroidales bacterium]
MAVHFKIFGATGGFRICLSLICAFQIAAVQTATAQNFSSVTVQPSSAVWQLGSSETLRIGFDDLNDGGLALRYRLQHCNPDFTPSELRQQETVTGINEVNILENELSFNTRANYVHYSFSFPSTEAYPRVSGNFLIQIYDVDNPSKYLLEIPVYIYEDLTQFEASVNVPRRVEYSRTKQELEVTVQVKQSLPITNTANVLLLVRQNQNVRTARRIPLTSSNGNYLEFRYQDALIFDGLNEYRNFDIRPLTYTAHGVSNNELIDGARHITLETDKSFRGFEYTSTDDINGQYVIKAARQSNSDLEADYLIVHFTLQSMFVPNADVYVMGDFTQWQTSPQYKMTYDAERGEYLLDLPLKQGFYDYTYDVVRDVVRGGGSVPQDDFTFFENTYYETENTYFLFLYYRPSGDVTHRLIGYRQISSQK